MIPENKQAAVKKALKTAFATDELEDIQPLTKGLSTALVFKITVRGNPYLLRVVTRTDAVADPTHYYGCMEIAAENKLAPQNHYLSIEDRVSITDFIIEQPFSIAEGREKLPQTLRKLHSLPRFPLRMNYFHTMEKFMPSFKAAGILPEEEINDLFGIFERLMSVYPTNDPENWVSSHNDSKPENIVFDGQKPWLIDWEAAFLNDRYLDLAIVANFVVLNEKDEVAYLETYFEGEMDEYKRARFFLMQEILHFYYLVFLMVYDKGEKPIDVNKIARRDFREFHNGMWTGAISLHHTDPKREYAMLHKEEFLLKAKTPRFEESLRIVSMIN